MTLPLTAGEFSNGGFGEITSGDYISGRAEELNLPRHKLLVSCDFHLDEEGVPLDVENDRLHVGLERSLVKFVDFAEKHQGQAVYVEVAIQATNSAGSCSMFDGHLQEQVSKGSSLEALDRQFGISRSKGRSSEQEQVVDLWARSGAGTVTATLPNLDNVPLDGLFVINKFSHFYYFSGPVVIRYRNGNGYDAARIHPVGNSQIFWKEISQIVSESRP